MSAGTLTLTNNSDIVTGIGTSFATELAAGDFVVVTVGGVPYTLPVKSVESDTGLTLVSVYTGPTQSGAAWSAVPRVALNMVTAALVAQSAEALRGLNYDKQNWQQVYSAAGNITVTLPDGSTFTGPSWKYLTDNTATINWVENWVKDYISEFISSGSFSLPNEAVISTAPLGGAILHDYTIKTRGVNTMIAGEIRGIGGESNDIWMGATPAGITEGNYVQTLQGRWYNGHWQFGGIRSGSTALDRVQLNISNGVDAAASFLFHPNGNAVCNQWISQSDKRVKSLAETIPDPLRVMGSMRGYSWYYDATGCQGFGFMSDEVKEYFPGGVRTLDYDIKMPDGRVVERVEAVDTYGIAAALHHEAILALMDQMKELRAEIKGLKGE